MDYVKEFRRFVNSYYLNDGIKTTIGILLPVLILSNLGYTSEGLLVAIGAMSLNIPDMPGPIRHRRNALLIMNGIIFFVSVLTGYAVTQPWGMVILIVVFCFSFSMLGVFGSRASAMGIGALLVMVISQHHENPLRSSLFVFAGGIWYTLLSLLFYGLRPYKLIQQSLGEYIFSASMYLRSKAAFYEKDAAMEKLYSQLVLMQTELQQKENMLAELLFNTRRVVRESTHTSRVLMTAFLEMADLVSIIMTTQQDYARLHDAFDDTDILNEYRKVILLLADELDQVGMHITQGNASEPTAMIQEKIDLARQHLVSLRQHKLNAKNLDVFISLRHILDSIEAIAARISNLHRFSSYDSKLGKIKVSKTLKKNYVSNQSYEPALIIHNFSFKSHIFRHSVRVTMAALAAYLIGQWLPGSRSYWILLTVIVISKPGYALSKTRNIERIVGTLTGAAIAWSILYFIKNETTHLILLVCFMIGGYSFIRWRYQVGVFLMTVYLLIAFHFLEPQPFSAIAVERVVDTLIGCLISFLAYWIIPPIWERQQISDGMQQFLMAARNYFEKISDILMFGNPEKRQYRIDRKSAWVALANISEALTRMLSEPKNKQQNAQELHRFVVSAHMLISHIVTLSYYAERVEPDFMLAEYDSLVKATVHELETAIANLNSPKADTEVKTDTELPGISLQEKIAVLKEKRNEEIGLQLFGTPTARLLSNLKSISDQFNFAYQNAQDLKKIVVSVTRS